MADHLREQIMDAVVTNVTGLVTTGTNVFRARTFPQESANLPALLIYQGPDIPDKEEDNQKYTRIDSRLTIIIEAWAQASSGNIDQILNLINKEVVVALEADLTQGVAGVIDTTESDVESPELLSEGSKRTGRMEMFWEIYYRRQRSDPSSI